MIEDLGLAGRSIGDQALVKDIQDILADPLKLGFNLVAVVSDRVDVLLGALGFLLLLDRGDDSPRGTSSTNNVLVRDGQQVTLIHGKLSTKLGNLLHVGNHLIVALSLLAEASEESLAITENGMSVMEIPKVGWTTLVWRDIVDGGI